MRWCTAHLTGHASLPTPLCGPHGAAPERTLVFCSTLFNSVSACILFRPPVVSDVPYSFALPWKSFIFGNRPTVLVAYMTCLHRLDHVNVAYSHHSCSVTQSSLLCAGEPGPDP